MSNYDYIYGTSAPDLNGPFIKLPMSFFFDEKFCSLSLLERLLYCALLDSTTLSRKRQCIDDSDRVYIELVRINMAKKLGVSEKTLVTALVGLENAGLIQQVRRGQGKCNLVYVKDYTSESEGARVEDCSDVEQKNLPNRPEKEENNINNINKNPRQSSISGSAELIQMDDRKKIEDVKERIEYSKLCATYQQDVELINVVVSVFASVHSASRKEYRISGVTLSAEVLRDKLDTLTSNQVSAVISGILHHRTKGILNLRKYVLTCLYAAAASGKYACAGTGESDATMKVKKNLFNDFHQREYSSSDWKRMEMAMLRKKWV